ncbi:MAG TPA: hypothetical protein PKK06_09420 [Phycisphaerae bacterium]|nr:hypothetical protein [Phycisphaerae bacterium]HNU45459.1 hypothetical protein [Phycisphaerae bacterium]
MGGNDEPYVLALTVYNGELIAGGYFTRAGEHVSWHWARWGCAGDCDLNGDEDVDEDDFLLFVGAFGTCTGQPGFLLAADFDGDGCITLFDYGRWLQCYADANGREFVPPSAPPADLVPLDPVVLPAPVDPVSIAPVAAPAPSTRR